MPIHALHEPIDVFSEWLDDCEAAANPHDAADGGAHYRENDQQEEEEDEEDDDDIPESSGLGNNKTSRDNAAQSSAGSRGSEQRMSHADLGLNDSDDEDDE
jgi:hypothetical protein